MTPWLGAPLKILDWGRVEDDLESPFVLQLMGRCDQISGTRFGIWPFVLYLDHLTAVLS
jgi:hypothetical protein